MHAHGWNQPHVRCVWLLQTGKISTPILSSILYLNHVVDIAETSRPGPTLICAQSWDHKDGCLAPSVPERSALVYPEFGRLALFQGDLAHGVLQSGFEGKRITFLMNWWAAPPKDIQRPTAAYIADRQLAPAHQFSVDRSADGIEGEAAVEEDARWWATPHCETKGKLQFGELVAAKSLLCRVVETSAQSNISIHSTDAAETVACDNPAAKESAEAGRAERVAKLVESAGECARDLSWQAAVEKGGVVIIDHPGYLLYQTPRHEIVLLPTLV